MTINFHLMKPLRLISPLAFFFLLTLTLPAQPRTLEVSPAGPHRTLRDAIAAARAGDRVIVQAGTYRESPVVIDKPLTLSGRPGAVIAGEKGKEGIVIAADGVTVEGMEIRDIPTSYLKDLAAIRVQRRRDFTIRNNTLINTFFGIYLEYGRQGVIAGNRIRSKARDEASSGNAIHTWYSDSLRIEGNDVRGHRDGIYLEFTHNSLIARNVSEGNLRYGLHFMFSNDDRYEYNRFSDNGAGVAVMFSKRIDMHRNRFEHNWGRAAYGLLLKEITDAEITENVFIENTIAINIEGASRINYRHNEFRRNGWAVKMAGGCLANAFTANNFAGNTLDLVVNSRVNDNTFDGNYWGEYSGYDLDRDGHGDVPHRPVKLFSYIVDRTPESMVLLRSFFVDLLNFAERVSPALTPADVLDNEPLMKEVESRKAPEQRLTTRRRE
jgi:nitrous oxidase accessory protein